MAYKNVHPLYSAMLDRWQKGRDSYAGEDTIKSKDKYLPPTGGHILDGYDKGTNTLGHKAYIAYRNRAVYPDIYAEAVEAMVGILHRKPPNIELPAAMEGMLTNATRIGESLEMVLRNINAGQLITGRIGVLGDIYAQDSSEPRPIISLYNEQAILNWDDISMENEENDLRMVVLDESRFELDRKTLAWKQKDEYLVLALINENDEPDIKGRYAGTRVESEDFVAGADFTVPNYRGTVLEKIPFAFINSKDVSARPDKPPLEGLANLCLAIYRGEADYRQNLFMQGQDTLVKIGEQAAADPDGNDEDTRVGAGAVINVPMGGDAKYIGVSSQGLPEQRQALENDYARAISKSGQIMDATSRARESGDALRMRISAQTATLPQIAKTGAGGLESVLKDIAIWMGANPDEVVVTPHMDFTNDELNGKTIFDIMQAKNAGAPISEQSVHGLMAERGMTELTYEEELERINNEEPRI